MFYLFQLYLQILVEYSPFSQLFLQYHYLLAHVLVDPFHIDLVLLEPLVLLFKVAVDVEEFLPPAFLDFINLPGTLHFQVFVGSLD